MARLAVALAASAALLAPGVAAAAPPPPDPAVPALVGTPELVHAGGSRVTLYVRLDRRVARRFDGELLARATVDGRFSSLAAVPGRRGRACYSASLSLPRAELGRISTAVLLVDGAEPVTTLVALRARRPGDARGAALGC
jgi:hypothetical protein